jgi:fructokinase
LSVPIWVCGEVLIDLIPESNNSGQKQAIVGGGPANTAKALARLGFDSYFIDGISTDAYGQKCKAELLKDGVKLDFSHYSDLPTCTADVSLDEKGCASYIFTIANTATFDFSASWLPKPVPMNPAVLQIGTLATVVEPGASILHDWASDVAQYAPIVFDPNVRPTVLSDHAAYKVAVAKWIGISSVVKVSEDDLAWLYPGQSEIHIARQWIDCGVVLVVITKGESGLVGITDDEVISVPAVSTIVVDTVGAGDTVGAIVVEAIAEYGLMALQGEILEKLLNRAAKAAAITCSRAGAQPPRQFELPGLKD